MLSRFYKKMESLTGLPNLLIAIVIQTLIMIIMLVIVAPRIGQYSTEQILDLRLFYSGNEAFQYFNDLGTPGLAWYGLNIFLDCLYPLAYTSTFIFLLIFLGKQGGFTENSIKIFFLLPLVLCIADYSENLVSTVMLVVFPGRIFLYDIAGYITFFKHTVLVLNILLVAFAGILALKKQFFKA